jgi:hypothetical protein
VRISLRHNSLQQTSGEIYALKRMTIVSFVSVARRYSAFRRSRAYQRMPMCSARVEQTLCNAAPMSTA